MRSPPPSESRCERLAGSPQRAHTAKHFVISSAMARSCRHRLERTTQIVLVEARDDHAHATVRERLDQLHKVGAKELRLVDPHDLRVCPYAFIDLLADGRATTSASSAMAL